MQIRQIPRLLPVALFRKCVAVLIPGMLFTGISLAQLTTYRINSAPDTPLSGTNASDYDTYALTSSLMTGATVDLHWISVDTGTSGDCPNVSFSSYDGTLTTLLSDGHPSGKFTNFIVMPVSEGPANQGSNSFTPQYVFTQTWANNAANAGACAGVATPSWSAGEAVLPGNYIYVNNIYWQETAQPWSSSAPFVGTCTTGSSEPGFLSGHSSYPDNTCTWTNKGSNAPPQDACFSSYYPGDGVILAANGGNPGCFNITNLPGTATITNLATGFPVSYETPMKVAWKNIIQQTILHYQTAPPTNLTLGYIRFGLSEGGETVPLVSGSWPYFHNPAGKGPASGASIVYLSYDNEMMLFQNAHNTQQGSDPPINMQADLNTWQGITDYPDQEALYATQNNIGIGTNGLQVADVTNINPPSGTCTSPSANISGDWCYNFQKYCSTKMPNGKYPICSLQTLQHSTPGNNNAVVSGSANTGSLSNEYWNNGTSWADFYGLVPTAKLYGANNLEIYTCDILFTVAYGFPTNNYPDTSNCNSNNSPLPPDPPYEVDYQNAFRLYLNSSAPGIYSPPPGSSTTTDSTITIDWNTNPGATSYNVQVGSNEGTQNFYHNANTPNGVTIHFTAQPSGTNIWIRWTPNNGSSIDYHYVTP